MKRKEIFRSVMLAMALFVVQNGQAQVSTPFNNPTFPGTDYVGWDNSTTVPLMVRHNANQPIEWYTAAIRRMLLQESATYAIGAFGGQVKDGSLLLSPSVDQFYNNGAPGPYSLLHLADADGTGQQDSYRPWMRTGITLTGNRDHQYIGQKAGEPDYTDLVIHWSDNPGEWLKDRLRFIFTSGYEPTATIGAQSTEGLEFMRMFPSRYEEPYIGIGDFYAANLADPTITEPTERLDMVNGRLRIRQLPDDPAHEGRYKVMVVDDAAYPDAERGVVKWVDPNDLPGGADCDWTVLNDGVSGPAVPHHVFTAVGASDDCPDDDDRVGIGTDAPEAKLHVRKGVLIDPNTDLAALFHNGAGAAESIGAMGWANGGDRNIGVLGLAENSNRDYGLWGIARNGAGNASAVRANASGAAVNNYGVEAFAVGGAEATAFWGQASSGTVGNIGVTAGGQGGQWAYGVYTRASGGSNANYGIYAEANDANAWAGWFEGAVNITTLLTVNNVVYPSDAGLKTDVADAAACLPVIAQLSPKSYSFTAAATEALNVDQEPHVGLIAQELEQVIPAAVHEVVVPAQYDSLGNMTAAQWSYKGVDYASLVPYLIGAVKELNAQLSAMQAQLAACCAAPPVDDGLRMQHGAAEKDAEGRLTPAQERLLRIAPNPFTDRTTLHCSLERGGRMQLIANSADGRDLRVLSEGQRQAGEFQYEWRTEHLAPGVYYVTLLLDGEPLVKRALKVGR